MSQTMKISVNGAIGEFESTTTVGELLNYLGLAGKPVVVELNQRALFPREHETAELQDGDVLELVQITAGG